MWSGGGEEEEELNEGALDEFVEEDEVDEVSMVMIDEGGRSGNAGTESDLSEMAATSVTKLESPGRLMPGPLLTSETSCAPPRLTPSARPVSVASTACESIFLSMVPNDLPESDRDASTAEEGESTGADVFMGGEDLMIADVVFSVVSGAALPPPDGLSVSRLVKWRGLLECSCAAATPPSSQ